MMTPSGNARAAPGPTTGRTISLGGLLLLFVASRLLYLVLVHPDFLLTFTEEELYRGAIARELVTGLSLPFAEYRADDYSGGSLVVGAIAAGFFLLLGPTVFALKLAPLLFFTLALVFWYLTLARHVSERVAVYFALIFTFSPPLFTAYSLVAVGFHTESIFFTALSLFLLCEMLTAPRPALMLTALLGLTAGVGLWFTYAYGVTLLAVVAFWLWHDHHERLKTRLLCFGAAFVIGFLPWISFNLQHDFSGLVAQGVPVWQHFSPSYLLAGLTDYRAFFPYQLLTVFASNDPADFLRRRVNLSYIILFLVPILAALVWTSKASRSAPAHPQVERAKVGRFGILYLCIFALIVQFSNLRTPRYYLPVYPFLFFFLANAVTRLQDAFTLIHDRIRNVFLSSLILLWLVAHSTVVSLDQAGFALSAKGYSYSPLLWLSLCLGNEDACPQRTLSRIEQTPVLTTILPKLPGDDQQEVLLETARLLADGAVSTHSQAEFSKFERLIPPGFEKEFYYWLGLGAMTGHRNNLPGAVAALEFLQQRSVASYRVALRGVFRLWPQQADLQASPESLTGKPVAVPLEVMPQYWRALGHYAGRYWAHASPSLGHLNAQMDSFLPKLDPSVQRYVLQGVGRFLFTQGTPGFLFARSIAPRELESLPAAYHRGLFEGVGMALGESSLFPWISWKRKRTPLWEIYTRGLAAPSVAYVQAGREEFLALFEEPS